MGNFREWLSDNLRYILLGLAIILILVAAIFAVKLVNKLNSDTPAETQKETQPMIAETNAQSETSVQVPALEQNVPAVLELMQQYYAAVSSKDIELLKTFVENLDEEQQQDILNDNYIESYSNITTYSKKGLADGSYVVYTYYDGKITGIDTLVPSLTAFYVKTDESGKLYVADRDADPDAEVFLEKTNAEQDVVTLIEDAKQKYDAAEASDPALKKFMDDLAVPETQSGANIPDSSDAGVEVNRVVTANTVCNVREDSTEDSEIIGMLNTGDSVTRVRTLDNGWSEIRYEGGRTGYVMSDFLTDSKDNANGSGDDGSSGDGADAPSDDGNTGE